MQSLSYTLSSSYFHHHKAVRALDIQNDLLISGSIDQTCQIFKKVQNKLEFMSAITIFDDYIYTVIIRPDLQGYIIGCKDHKIYLLDIEGNPIGVLESHEDAVSSLSIELGLGNKQGVLVSGSWDKTAKIWDLDTNQLLHTLGGHSFAVAVLIFKGIIITGSQDGKLHFWNLQTGKETKCLEKAHKDIIRELVKMDSLACFLSCSNDETFKLWTLDGELVQQFQGHESYVFSVKPISMDLYVSGSDDRTIKIWNHDCNCIQTIEHPNTVWFVAVDYATQDIVTACADGGIRVFTTDTSRIAPESELKEFEASCQASKAQNNPGLTHSELEKLPTVSSQSQIFGKKDGEIRLFRNGNQAEAYVWKSVEKIWEKIGDVISGNQRKYYEGDNYFPAGEYDYVFDVEIESQINSKLPYNEGDNPLETAEKFLAREKLNKGHIEQITGFLRKNTRGIHKQSNTNQNKTVQKQVMKESFKYFPTNIYLRFEGMNLQGLQKKALENNGILQGQLSNKAMNEKEAKYFDNILEILNNTNMYHSSQLSPFQFDFFRNKLLNWPLEYKLPIYDMLRIFLLHSQSEELFSGLNAGLDILTDICGILQGKAGENDGLIGLCIKILVNMFIQVTNQNSMLKNCSIIFDSMIVVLEKYRHKVNLINFLSNLVLNYSIALAINFEIPENEVKRYGEIVVEFLKVSLNQNNSSVLKGMVAIGTLLVCPKKNYVSIIKEKTAIFLKNYKSQIQDSEREKADECQKDILDYLI